MSCSRALLKLLMVIFNLVIFIAGAATMVIGGLVKNYGKGVVDVLNGIKDVPPVLGHVASAYYPLIAVGAVLTLLGFLGCCGACCENKCMLGTFFFIVLVMFFAEVITALVILIYRPQMEKVLDKLRHSVAENIKKDYGQNNITTNAWDNLMSLMTCCGYNNYTDFTNSPFEKLNSASLYPKQCCSSQSEKCDINHTASSGVDGCFDSVVKFMTTHSSVLAAVAIAVAGVEVALMIMSIALYKK